MDYIGIRYENDDNARLYTDGKQFIIEADIHEVYNADKWEHNKNNTICRRTGITFEELIRFIPNISEYLGLDIKIISNTHPASKRHISSIDDENLCTTFYKILVGNETVYNKNTFSGGCVNDIRMEIINFIARFVYDCQLYKKMHR